MSSKVNTSFIGTLILEWKVKFESRTEKFDFCIFTWCFFRLSELNVFLTLWCFSNFVMLFFTFVIFSNFCGVFLSLLRYFSTVGVFFLLYWYFLTFVVFNDTCGVFFKCCSIFLLLGYFLIFVVCFVVFLTFVVFFEFCDAFFYWYFSNFVVLFFTFVGFFDFCGVFNFFRKSKKENCTTLNFFYFDSVFWQLTFLDFFYTNGRKILQVNMGKLYFDQYEKRAPFL